MVCEYSRVVFSGGLETIFPTVEFGVSPTKVIVFSITVVLHNGKGVEISPA